MSDKPMRLPELLDSSEMLVAPFVYDALQAKVAEAAGFRAVYMTGFGTAAARGHADLGVLTMTEMVDNVRTIAGAVRVPLICDADTGYGNPLNVVRTVRAYEDAGAAALHLEDQVWPKRCGFFAGKEVIPLAEMVAKLRAGCDARRTRDLLIIARTDALQPQGWEEAERRARAYREAGADLIFVDGIMTLDDLNIYAQRLGDLPLLYNGHLLPVAEVAKRGFRLMLHPATLAVVYVALRDALAELQATGAVSGVNNLAAYGEIVRLLGVAELLQVARGYEA